MTKRSFIHQSTELVNERTLCHELAPSGERATADGEAALTLAGAPPTVTAIASSANTTLALRSDGTVWAWGYSADSTTRRAPMQLSNLNDVTAIATGDNH